MNDRIILCVAVALIHASVLVAEQPPSSVVKKPDGAHAFDLSHWKLTLPVDSEKTNSGHPIEVSANELTAGFTDEHFRFSKSGEMMFWCPVNGATTEGTDYARSELREMLQPGNVRKNWPLFGTHTLDARCRILQVPSNPKVVIGQIHSYSGKAKPLVKLQYFKGRIEALVKSSPDKGKDLKLTFPGIEMREPVDWQIKVHDRGELSITVNDKTQSMNVAESDPDWAKQTFYFKAGVYPQDNAGNSAEGARVSFAKMSVTHQ